MFHYFARFICFAAFKVLFRIKAYGRKNIPKTGGFILASNHASYLDPVAVGISCPRLLNYMARHDLFRKPVANWILTAVGTFPVKRNSADISALKEAIRRLKAGGGLVVFPQGRRSQTLDLEQGSHAGVGFLVEKTGVPVVPVFVKGTDQALPAQAKRIKLAKIRVYFGEPLVFEKGIDYQQAARSIMAEVRRLSELAAKF